MGLPDVAQAKGREGQEDQVSNESTQWRVERERFPDGGTRTYVVNHDGAICRMTPVIEGSSLRYADEDMTDEAQQRFASDAALIVRAVNCHDDLLSACEGAPTLSRYHGQRGFEVERFIVDYEAWCATCRAAAKKARTKP